jgi:hypothetical protein
MSYSNPRETLLVDAKEVLVKIGSGINSILPVRQRPDGSPLFIPFLTLTWLSSALKRALYFAFGSHSLVPRELDLDAKATVNGWRRGDDHVFAAVQNRSVAPRVAVFALH